MIIRYTHLVLSTIWQTFPFSKHIAANKSKAGRALASGGEENPLHTRRAAMAVQAPAAHRASCSMGPPHHIERIRTTQARAVGEPSRAISVLKYVTVNFFYFTFLALLSKYCM